MWKFLDHNLWQTVVTLFALVAAYCLGKEQNKVNFHGREAVEVYLDKYIFNGRVYETAGQVLPSTYSQAINNFYRVELPTNGDVHVSLEIFYRDLENRKWSSIVYADKSQNNWDIKTLPRKVA